MTKPPPNVPRESNWLTPEDRAQGELALGALNSLRKTFEHWMLLATFFYRMRKLADDRGDKKGSFRTLLDLNGFDETKVDEIGGYATVSRLVRIGEKEPEVREWHRKLQDHPETASLKWSAPTTIIKHCEALQTRPADEPGLTGTPNKRKQNDLSNARLYKEAKIEVERLQAQLKEVEEERDNSNISDKATPRDAFELLSRLWSREKCKQLAKLLMEGEYPDGPRGPSGGSSSKKSKKNAAPQREFYDEQIAQMKPTRGESNDAPATDEADAAPEPNNEPVKQDEPSVFDVALDPANVAAEKAALAAAAEKAKAEKKTRSTKGPRFIHWVGHDDQRMSIYKRFENLLVRSADLSSTAGEREQAEQAARGLLTKYSLDPTRAMIFGTPETNPLLVTLRAEHNAKWLAGRPVPPPLPETVEELNARAAAVKAQRAAARAARKAAKASKQSVDAQQRFMDKLKAEPGETTTVIYGE
jgi:hypothetical protein